MSIQPKYTFIQTTSLTLPNLFLLSGCRKVVIASSSPDAPLYSVGVNDSKVDPDQAVTSHVSAPTAALTPVLSILQKEFGIR